MTRSKLVGAPVPLAKPAWTVSFGIYSDSCLSIRFRQ